MNSRTCPIPVLCLSLALGCTTNVDLGELTQSTDKTDSGDPSGPSSDTVPDDTDAPATSTEPPSDTTTGAPGSTGTADTGTTNSTSAESEGTTAGSETANSTSTESTSTTGDSDSVSSTSTDSDVSTGGDTGNADLDGWLKYREVQIDNGLMKSLDDYQVLVKVNYDSDMAADFADLRFTDITGKTMLPHWVESYSVPVDAYVWVRVPSVLADDITTIRMYYGNPMAQDSSDGDATFLFFDGFSGDTLDAAKWKTTAPVALSFGQLTITKGAVYSAKQVSAFPDTRLEARVQWGNGVGSGCLSANQGQGAANLPYLARSIDAVRAWDGQQDIILKAAQESPPIPSIAVDSKYNYFFWGRNSIADFAGPPLPITYFAILGDSAGSGAGMSDIPDMIFDWVLVRRFSTTEPMTFVGGEKPA